MIRSNILCTALILALGACSSTSGGGNNNNDSDNDDDDDDFDRPDARPRADAEPSSEEMTLSQTETDDIVKDNSIGCLFYDDGVPTHNEANSYYRVFDLGEMDDVDGGFEIEQVNIGIELAESTKGSQPATIRLHTLTGELKVANLDQVSALLIDIPDQVRKVLTVDINETIPKDSKLVVELEIPDANNGERLFVIGSNTGGETAPAYMRAANCDIDQPTTFEELSGRDDINVVMSLTGTDGR
jgi:hypothetical protein